jgi:hypothetical protein
MRAKIGGSSNLTERLPRKPKWMRWRTYGRHLEACIRADSAATGYLAAYLDTLKAKIHSQS